MKSSLEIHLLGPFRLAVDGVLVDEKNFPRRKPKLLIKLLALQPHRQLHREQVMEFLWPDLDVASAANSLHKSIHAARRALEPGLKSGGDSRFIITHEQQIQLRASGGLSIDVEVFEQAAASALKSSEAEPYEHALKLYSGDLLLEDPYEEWTITRRESLRGLHSELLLKLAQLHEGQQRYAQGIERLKQLLSLDPANEEVHRGLMRLYALIGNRHQAIKQFHQCAELIRRELDAEPDSKTVELYKEIESGRTPPAKLSIDNVPVSQAYLKATYHWNKRTEGGLKKANEYFAEAIQENPTYAPAYAGLAESYALFSWYSVLRPKDAFPAARDAALRAIALDDSLAEAHTAMAWIHYSYDWNWTDAERELKRAIQLNPGYATAHQWYAIFLSGKGRHEEAIAQIERAVEVDLLSRVVNRDVGWVFYFARLYDQAIEAYRKTIELDPNFYIAHYFLGETYEIAGKYEEAIAEFRDTKTHAKEEAEVWTLLGHARAHALLGEKNEAHQVINELVELSKKRYVSPYLVAAIYARLGDKEGAFEWLARAYDERDSYLVYLAVEPVLDDLRSDRRFTDLLRKVGLAPQQRTSTIAILPLLNESTDAEMDYLSDGLTESIIRNLSQLPSLRILAWGTVAHYKGQKISPLEAGRALGVEAVLTGRVLQLAQRLVVRAELISSKDGVHLWGGQYDRELADIFSVQEQIAKEISANLRLKLTGEEKKRLAKRHTENAEAYQAYLKGRYYWNKRDVMWLKKGVEYFRQAIDLDPGYVLAYVGLSDSYTLLVVREAISPEEGFAKAKAAAAVALKIDDTVAEAYASLGHAMLHNWEWDAAEKQLRKSIELNAGYPSAHHWYSEHLTAIGRCDESIAELKLASDLDPLSLVINADLGRAFYYARQYEEVIQQETRTLEMDPHFWLSHINLGRSFIQQGRHSQAIMELERAAQASPGNTEVLAFLGFAYAAAQEKEAALKTLASLEERTQQNHVPPYHFAILYSGLCDKEHAFEYLERAYQKHAVDLFTLKVEPMFDGLRSDARFSDLLRRVGLTAELPREIDSIAILPLVNLSSDPEMEYLSDGLSESIINSLSQLSRLKVIARSTVFRYKGQEVDPQALGRKLGVRSVLTGRALYRGDTLNVQTELVDVRDGRQLWGEQYKRKSADVLEVQEEIAREIVAKLRVRLTGEEEQRLAKRYTADTNAYQLYLRGRYHWNKRTAERLQKGIECFQQAIDTDPKFALAYAGLSDCYAFLGDVGLAAIPSKDAFSRAKEAAIQALKIDDDLPEAYLSLAHVNMHHFEWPEALQAFQRALALNPNHSVTHQWYAFYLLFNGRNREAIAEAARAVELDPLSVAANVDFGQMFYFTGAFDQAIEQYLKTLELEPSHHKTYLWLGWAYEQKGMYEDAIRSFRKAEQDYEAEALVSLGSVYALSGRTDEARKIIAKLDEMSGHSYVSPYEMSLLFLSLDDDAKAFEWLEKAYDQRAEWMIYLYVDPRFNRVRDNSRFKNILREVFGKNR